MAKTSNADLVEAWYEVNGLTDVASVEALDDSGVHLLVTFTDGTERRSTYPTPYPFAE